MQVSFLLDENITIDVMCQLFDDPALSL